MQQPPARGFRPDIQALRALAVGGVVVFHLFPGRLTGGFAGVDVFFVISGFLITSHLVEHPPEHPRDLTRFWARRIRRLLPASLLVLLTTLVAARLIAPAAVLPDTARMARAAASYWINWLLAHDSIDYLHADDFPTAVQHFWSLSVEEQFYAGWPVLLLALVLIAKKLKLRQHAVILAGLSVVVAASLAISIHLTTANPPAAYFVTQTRIWELGIGALLGVWVTWNPTWRPPLAPVVAWLGVAGIALTFVLYDGSTPFPGYQALLPTLATAAVIAARPETGPLGALARFRPVQFLGDISYSVYLWHWPLIVLTPFVTDQKQLRLVDKVAIVVAAVVLAALTKRWVEDPARTWKPRSALRWTYLAGVAGMVVVVGLATAQLHRYSNEVQAAEAGKEVAIKRALDPTSCLGASALGRVGCPAPQLKNLVLAPDIARLDRPRTHPEIAGGKACPGQEQNNFKLVTCVFGDTGSDRTVVLAGDSHAQHWLPAMEKVAAEDHFRVVTRVSSGCSVAPVLQKGPTPSWTDGCQRWSTGTTRAIIAAHPALVVLSNRTFRAIPGKSLKASYPDYVTAATGVLRELRAAGIPVLVLRDTPIPGQSVPLCIGENTDDLTACDGTPKTWIRPDSWVPAVKAVADPRVRLLDLNQHLCTADRCPAIIGDFIAYYDSTHMTASFNATLAPYLRPVIADMMK